jgi:mannitol/fructose-specific phosphotransferase system IIA component (Ntr-type)
MAEKLDEKELVTFKEMLMANSVEVDALCELLIEKGIITEQKFYTKLKEVQAEYEKSRKNVIR